IYDYHPDFVHGPPPLCFRVTTYQMFCAFTSPPTREGELEGFGAGGEAARPKPLLPLSPVSGEPEGVPPFRESRRGFPASEKEKETRGIRRSKLPNNGGGKMPPPPGR
ncbi:MAG: hypothetical protein N2556_10120, partial [Anaerolineae bacterium]|nr:hypothetical protein [Anaerolineae bacterium]